LSSLLCFAQFQADYAALACKMIKAHYKTLCIVKLARLEALGPYVHKGSLDALFDTSTSACRLTHLALQDCRISGEGIQRICELLTSDRNCLPEDEGGNLFPVLPPISLLMIRMFPEIALSLGQCM
jgi:hypothetical protein